MTRPFLLLAALLLPGSGSALAQSEPGREPSVQAVARAMPAVVNINTERIVKRTVREPYDEFFNQFFGGPMRRPRTVAQKVQSLGSGFLVDRAGYIVTNEHVVERAEDLKISVTTTDGKTYEARYVAGSAESDLALIKIESPEPLPFIDLGDLSPNLLGQTVLVLGNPLGYGSSVARGILSARNRTVAVNEVEYKDLIQTDAAINPGNSGGPLVDLSGKLIGVSSVKMAFTPQGVPTQGLGFAIAGELVRDKVAEFKRAAAKVKATPKAEGSLARQHFGLHLQDLTAELAASFGTEPGAGVLIADVEAASPVARSGFQRGQIIHQIGRHQIASVRQVEELLTVVSTGSQVDFTVSVVRQLGGRAVRQLQTATVSAR